jgi:Protein of unknown function (DUF3716)
MAFTSVYYEPANCVSGVPHSHASPNFSFILFLRIAQRPLVCFEQTWCNSKSVIKKLQKLAPQSELSLRSTKKLKELGKQKKYNAEAIVGQVLGKTACEPCDNSEKGNGPFFDCVIVNGYFDGACANSLCWPWLTM